MSGERYLIDTSAWLQVLGRRQADPALSERIARLVGDGLAVTTGIIRLELLSGTRIEAEWRRLSETLSGVASLSPDEDLWDEAALLGFRLRRQGVTIPNTDLVIAALAIRHKAIVIHRDRHFDIVAAHEPLRVEGVLPL